MLRVPLSIFPKMDMHFPPKDEIDNFFCLDLVDKIDVNHVSLISLPTRVRGKIWKGVSVDSSHSKNRIHLQRNPSFAGREEQTSISERAGDAGTKGG